MQIAVRSGGWRGFLVPAVVVAATGMPALTVAKADIRLGPPPAFLRPAIRVIVKHRRSVFPDSMLSIMNNGGAWASRTSLVALECMGHMRDAARQAV